MLLGLFSGSGALEFEIILNLDNFSSNILSMLMIPVYEKKIETTEDIFIQDKIPLVNLAGSFWKEFLETSPNSWERKSGNLNKSIKGIF